MKRKLADALQQIRWCRNNMNKADFLDTVREITNDNNVMVPLLEIASVCSVERMLRNVKGDTYDA